MNMQIVKAFAGSYDRFQMKAASLSAGEIAKKYGIDKNRVYTIVYSRRVGLYPFEIEIKALWKQRQEYLEQAKRFSPMAVARKYGITERRAREVYNEIRSKRNERDWA